MQCGRNNSIAATHTSKACCLGERTHFNGTFLSTVYFVNAVRNVRIRDERFIRSIKDNDCFICLSVSNPFFQLFSGICGTGRVVWRAEVNQICMNRRIWHSCKTVGFIRICINYRSAVHFIRIYINRICRIRNQYNIVIAKNVYNIAAVTLGTVIDTNFIQFQRNAKLLVISCNCFFQEIIAGAAVLIATEGFFYAHFIGTFFHCLYANRCNRQCNIADAHTNQRCVWIFSHERIDFFCNIDEQIILFQLQKILIDRWHLKYSFMKLKL